MFVLDDSLIAALASLGNDGSSHSTALSSSSDCSYYSCDHTSDGVNNLTKDGVIYPDYKPFGAVAEPHHGPTMLADPPGCTGYACDNSADYIGSDGNLLTDGVIYPAQAKSIPLPMLDSSDCSYYSCDHSADYIGTNSDGVNNLTAPGTIYPDFKYGVWGANMEHTNGVQPTMLADGSHSLPSDNSGAYYCTEPEANCSIAVADPPTPAITLAAQASSLYQTTNASGAYYCSDPAASCSPTVVDPVLQPIVYPATTTCALAAPVVAPAVSQANKKPSRPSPGHLLLMGHACIFGALDATAKVASGLFNGEEGKAWSEEFVASSTAAAGAVTPVGGFILREHVLKSSA